MLKEYKRKLYNHLQETPAQNQNVPLQNIKNSLGSVALMKGNPLTKTEISLQITIQYSNSGVPGPILPFALAPQNQTSVPIILFGLTDLHGGYIKSLISNPPIPNWQFILCGIIGFQGFVSPFGPLFLQPSIGDMIIFYQSPNGITQDGVIIYIHCESVAYGTFLNSFVSDLITINSLRYIIPIANVNQFINPLIFGYQTLFGKTTYDSIDPRMYITSKNFQQQIADIPLNLPIDKAVFLTIQNSFFSQFISIVLFVEKVEPLTHKNK